MPTFFINILMYILGGLLVLAGIQQIVSLISVRKWTIVPWVFYLIPVLILVVGIVILVYPFQTAANTFIVFGIASIIYGISELINSYKFRKREKVIIQE